MIQQDYLMRQIEIVARTLAKLIFNKETTEYIVTDIFHSCLLGLIAERRIDEAENLLFEKIEEEIEENPGGKKYLEIALDFYSRINDLETRVLDGCGFEREEIDEGIRAVADLYGINII